MPIKKRKLNIENEVIFSLKVKKHDNKWFISNLWIKKTYKS
jgi:hypothetical protein